MSEMDNQGKLKAKMSEAKEHLIELSGELRSCFRRPSTARLASDYIRGLLSSVERKNGWQLAEEASHRDPYRIQKLLTGYVWNADQLRDIHFQRVGRKLGYEDGILAIDETGFLKKGTKSAGVARQYTGTAGKVENAQVGVFASWKTKRGQTLIDRELYLPKEWTEDLNRCKEAQIPDDRLFMTKNKLAIEMYKRIAAAGYCPSYVVADEVYGKDSYFRGVLEQHDQAYVVAVACEQQINFGKVRVKMSEYSTRFKERDWKRRSVGDGSKGPRLYDWALEEIEELQNGFKRILLFRRSLSDPKDIAYYFGYTKKEATYNQIIRAAGSRWSIEECFESAKGEVGLDQYEVRNWHGWYRHITLAMVAHSFLVITKNKVFPEKKPERKPFEDFKKKRFLLSA